MSYTRSFSGMPSGRDPIKPRFHIASVQDDGATAQNGMPMFRDEERVQMIIPGNPLNSPVRVVNDEHKQRWPAEYAAFKAGITMATDGTPIEQWPLMTPAMVRTLKYLEIHTVQQCAQLNDQALQKIGMGGRNIKNAAIAYLDDADAMKMTTELSRAVELKDTQIAALTAQVQQLGEMMERMQRDLVRNAEAPSAVDTFVPGIPGFAPAPVTAAQVASPLDSFQMPRRPGRPRKVETEDVAA